MFGIVYSIDKPNIENNSKPKAGIGLEFTFLSGLFSNDGITRLYIPIHHLKGYMIEPEIIYYKDLKSKKYPDNSELNYEEETKGMGIGIGLYILSFYERMNMYSGIKVGYLVSSDTPYASYRLDGSVETTEILIAPTIGSEYHISDNFTIGGEVALQIMKQKIETPVDASLNGIESLEERVGNVIRPKFMVRFYF